MPDVPGDVRTLLEAYKIVHPGDRLLIMSDNEGQSMWLGHLAMDAANAMGAEASLVIINTPDAKYEEPPESIAAATKKTDVVLRLSDKANMAHSTVQQEAHEMGIRWKTLPTLSIDDIEIFTEPSLVKELPRIKKTADVFGDALTKANSAKVTSAAGTDIKMSLAGRSGISINSLDPMRSTIGPYAEGAISPVEGTAEGIIVISCEFLDVKMMMNTPNFLKEPMKLTVHNGRVVDVSGQSDEVKKMKEFIASTENADNIGELGIGACHKIPAVWLGTRMDCGRLGTVHFGLGRNNDIGGQTMSNVHRDVMMEKANVELDGKQVLNNGELMI